MENQTQYLPADEIIEIFETYGTVLDPEDEPNDDIAMDHAKSGVRQAIDEIFALAAEEKKEVPAWVSDTPFWDLVDMANGWAAWPTK